MSQEMIVLLVAILIFLLLPVIEKISDKSAPKCPECGAIMKYNDGWGRFECPNISNHKENMSDQEDNYKTSNGDWSDESGNLPE